jgi:hypothetical protein
MTIKVLALDLERTLVTNVISRWPRPGLYPFLEFCLDTFEKVVIFTGSSTELARETLQELAEKGSIPGDFLQRAEILDWEGSYKDLRYIRGYQPEEILIVDDYEDYILPQHKEHWIPIKPYDPPGIDVWLPAEMQAEPEEDSDRGLYALQEELLREMKRERGDQEM